MTFGEWLAKARETRGTEWTQERLATDSGISVKTIAAIEQGKIKDPRLSTVQALCSSLNRDFFAESQRYNAKTPSNEVAV